MRRNFPSSIHFTFNSFGKEINRQIEISRERFRGSDKWLDFFFFLVRDIDRLRLEYRKQGDLGKRHVVEPIKVDTKFIEIYVPE